MNHIYQSLQSVVQYGCLEYLVSLDYFFDTSFAERRYIYAGILGIFMQVY